MDVQPLPQPVKTVAACLLCAVLGGLVGRMTSPTRVEVREVESKHAVSGSHEKKAIARVITRTIVIVPDAGTTIAETIREDEKSDSTATAVVDVKRETETKVPEKFWRAGPKVGVMPLAPGAPALVVGAEVGLTIPNTALEVDAWGLVPVTAPDRFVVGGGLNLRW